MRVRIYRGYLIPDMAKPREVHLEITTACNLDCTFCFRRSWDEGALHMDFGTFLRVADEIGDVDVIWLDGWGEPLTHPNFVEVLGKLSSNFRIGIVTNGSLLEDRYREIIENNVEWVVVSVEDPDELFYSTLRRGGHLRKVEEGIRRLVGCRGSKPSVWASTIVMRRNLAKIPHLVEWAAGLDLNGILLSNLIPTTEDMKGEALYGRVQNNPMLEECLHRARTRAILHRLRLLEPEFEYRTERTCPFVHDNSLAICRDGTVVPCLFALHTYRAWVDGRSRLVRQYSFGNVLQRSLDEVWDSPEYVRFRAKVNLFQFPSCNDCRFNQTCDLSKSNEADCWGNKPSCAFCPYSRRIVQCPRESLLSGILP